MIEGDQVKPLHLMKEISLSRNLQTNISNLNIISILDVRQSIFSCKTSNTANSSIQITPIRIAHLTACALVLTCIFP